MLLLNRDYENQTKLRNFVLLLNVATYLVLALDVAAVGGY